MPPSAPKAVIIGAGIAGLATAARLRAAGFAVTVLERHETVGGKIRTVASKAGPIDAGPTVLTMRHVIDELFATLGADLDAHVSLIRQEILARHFWPDGSTLDLSSDHKANAAAITAFSDHKAADQYKRFNARTGELFAAFDKPMMQAAEPKVSALAATVMKRPRLLSVMSPFLSLEQLLKKSFDDPRLRQLFGRYATYVGGCPGQSPALLSLIWQAEAAGVWVVQGGMHKLVQALVRILRAHDVEIVTKAHVHHLEKQAGRITRIHLDTGQCFECDVAVFAGDPRALATGALGDVFKDIARITTQTPRSLSARVLSFAATPNRKDLLHHNIFFQNAAPGEFSDLSSGRAPESPSFYICALDRGQGETPPEVERFEIITNAPATNETEPPKDLGPWLQQITRQMAQLGMAFAPTPDIPSVTTPQMFATMFPESLGALYGQSPHGMTAALKRPRARTRIPNLYLAGGGTHPGAGIPMATLSARHAVEAILRDQNSTLTSDPMAMLGGISTG